MKENAALHPVVMLIVASIVVILVSKFCYDNIKSLILHGCIEGRDRKYFLKKDPFPFIVMIILMVLSFSLGFLYFVLSIANFYAWLE